MTTKNTFEAAARVLAEANILGLFAEGTAHEIVTNQFADIFEGMNVRFNRDLFIQASGVKLVDHSNDEPIRKVCSNRFVQR